MRKGILLLFLSFFLATGLQAQDDSKITLQEAIDLALENNYQLDVARNDLELTNKQVRGEKADYLPSLNANFSGNRNIGRSFNENTGQITTRTNNSLRSGLNFDLPIFSGFENLNSLKSTKYGKQSSQENLQRVRANIIFETANNYLQFILNRKFLEIDRENLEASRKTLEQVRAQVEVGSRPKVDLYNQQSTVASNELAVVNARNSLQSSRLQLIQTLQIDPLEEYEFTSPQVDMQSVTAQEYDLEKLVNTALENRDDFQREKFNIQSIKHQLKATRGSLYPSLSLSGSFSSSYSELQPFSFQDQFLDQNINRSIGLSLNIPIFSNLSRRLNVQSQEISYRNAQLNLRDTELQIVQEVNQAYNDYQSYVQELESSEKSLQAAERSYRSQKERYEVGAGTLVELSDANAQYIEAQASRAQALFRLIFQQQLLDYYIGKMNREISL